LKHWLLKTEPEEYSYDDLEHDGKTTWNGVTNNLALIHLRSMSKGDQAFIYHTGSEKQVVGIAEILTDPYPDPKAKDARIVVVDVKPKLKLVKPIPLGQIKGSKEFVGFELVRIPRLSVMPVDEKRWNRILELSET
jgi:predicted RNA-binding protein with PUA-like domain